MPQRSTEPVQQDPRNFELVLTAYGPALKKDVDLCRCVATDAANRLAAEKRAAMKTAAARAKTPTWDRDTFLFAAQKLDELCRNAAACLDAGEWMFPANRELYGRFAVERAEIA